MKTVLIFPPTADPTAPYLALPALAGFLRAAGEEVILIDANVEAYHSLLQPAFLTHCQERIDARFSTIKRKAHLRHDEKLAFPTLAAARNLASFRPDKVSEALARLKEPGGIDFYEPQLYESAIATISDALQLISATFTPLILDFTQYRTPFSLLSLEEIERDARPERNPFAAYFAQELLPRLHETGAKLIGISVVFPGQIQPAYSLALEIRRQLPDVHLTIGGPAMTQILLRLPDAGLKKALRPFNSAVRFEGEKVLLDLIRQVTRGAKPTGIFDGWPPLNLTELPAPDFNGLPLDKYFSPEPVLPYDPSRGCYWGRCAFCHYGLTAQGTAGYRERPVEKIIEHLLQIQQQWHNRIFYFSHDTMSPKLAERVAREISAQKIACRWGTDMRPEKKLTPELCATLAEGGALSAALGIESAAPRVLKLINKGATVPEMATAIQNLADAGIAVEAMCFSGFPTETFSEARETLAFLEQQRAHLALFIYGQFGLVSGARVAQQPQDFGIREIWQVAGDEFIGQLFYEEKISPKSETQIHKIDQLLDRLAASWWLHRYPWAGSLSTAHTLLWYDHFGPEIFKQIAENRPLRPLQPSAGRIPPRILAAQSREAEIWETMIYERRAVSRRIYRELLGTE